MEKKIRILSKECVKNAKKIMEYDEESQKANIEISMLKERLANLA